MILDAELLAWDEQAITVTTNSDVIDLGKNMGAGQPLNVLAQVIEDFEPGATATLALSFKACNYSGFGTDVQTLFSAAAIDAATLVAGYEWPIGRLPDKHYRYLRFTATVAGATCTAGKLTCGVLLDKQTNDAEVAVDTDV